MQIGYKSGFAFIGYKSFRLFRRKSAISALSANQFFLLRLKEISLSSKPSDIPSFLKHSEAFSE